MERELGGTWGRINKEIEREWTKPFIDSEKLRLPHIICAPTIIVLEG